MYSARHHVASVRITALIAFLSFCGQAQDVPSGETRSIEQAQQMIGAGRLNDAAKTLQEGVRLYPRSGGLYNLIGIVAAEQNKPAEAKSAFLKAVKYSPNLTPALLNLARIYHAEGAASAAIETYQRALRLNNGLEEAHANLAALFLDRGNYAAAEEQLTALPPAVAEQDRFRALECAALAGSGRRVRAAQVASQISKAATEADVSLAAFTLERLNENALVIQLLEPVVKNGASREARGLLATACAKQGALAQARAIFDSLARENSSDVQPLAEAARIAWRQKDYEGAAAYLLRGVEIDSDKAELQFFLGVVCIELNLPGDAVHALREAVHLKPNVAAYNYALGVAILTSERAAEAVAYFRKYVALRPADVHGHLALATAEFETGDADAARRELTPLVSNPAVAVGAHYILGRICRQETNLDEARAHFAAALNLDPDNAILAAHLADVLIRQNRLPEARRELDRALALDPNNYFANENLLLLLRRQKDPQAVPQAQRFATLTQKASDDRALLFRHIQIER